jgi:sensor histidine kinase YesM
MTLHKLILTNRSPEKYVRHVIFWTAQNLFWTLWATSLFDGIGSIVHGFKIFSFFILEMIFTYTVAYFFLPAFRKRRSPFLVFLFVVFTLVLFVMYIFYHLWIFNVIKLPRNDIMLATWYFGVNFFTMGPPVLCSMFLTFKMCKEYYLKMEEKRRLTEENAAAQLLLLKAQVHPHFLFNTLNNMYSFALNQSPHTGMLVKKLSHTMEYMIFECDAALVPLQKELNMIKDYMELERIRYGDRLQMSVSVKGNIENKVIAPLLMIPIVENSFKHGASQILLNPKIHLQIEVTGNTLLFELTNTKPPVQHTKGKNGIGLDNVQKRLKLLYTNRHQLLLTEENDQFKVRMQLELDTITAETRNVKRTEEYNSSIDVTYA